MERLRGRTLTDEMLARGKLPEEEAVSLAVQALHGLAAVHAAGMIHRDVKPDNLFVCDSEGRQARIVKVLDLGVAKMIEGAGANPAPSPLMAATEADVSLGTPRFFSPEQASGSALDVRTDIYSMGLVLYALLAGRGPFDQLASVSEVLAAHIGVQPTPPSIQGDVRISPGVEAAILRAIAKGPADRFPSAASFAQALRTAEGSHASQPLTERGGATSVPAVAARAPTAHLVLIVTWMLLVGCLVVLVRTACR